MNVNLGSGPHYVDGWVCYDKSPNIFLSKFPFLKKSLSSLKIINDAQIISWDPRIKYGDVRVLRFPDNSIKNFYMSHVLEHVYFEEARQILSNCYKALEKNGTLRICSPDYESFILKYIQEATSDKVSAANNFRASLLSHPARRPSTLKKFLNSQAGHIHFWHPFKEQMLEILNEIGYTNVMLKSFQEGTIWKIDEVELRGENSFYIEASKN